MGFFAGLNVEKYDRQYTDRQLFTRITDYFKPQVKRLAGIVTLVIAFSVVGASLPILVGKVVDLLKGQPTLPAIALVGLLLVLIGAGLWGINWARRHSRRAPRVRRRPVDGSASAAEAPSRAIRPPPSTTCRSMTSSPPGALSRALLRIPTTSVNWW